MVRRYMKKDRNKIEKERTRKMESLFAEIKESEDKHYEKLYELIENQNAEIEALKKMVTAMNEKEEAAAKDENMINRFRLQLISGVFFIVLIIFICMLFVVDYTTTVDKVIGGYVAISLISAAIIAFLFIKELSADKVDKIYLGLTSIWNAIGKLKVVGGFVFTVCLFLITGNVIN